MENNPVLSVIIPVYNAEKYLAACLDSVLGQTLQSLEVLCIDDGSQDSSAQLVEQYAAKDARVRLIRSENGGPGPGHARNLGLAAAVGEFVGFVDSDDFVAPDMFEKMVACARRDNSDVVMANIYLYYGKEKATPVYRNMVQYLHWQWKSPFPARQEPEVLRSIGLWDKIYRRELLEQNQIRNPERRVYEDHLFSYKALVLAKQISVISEPLYYYRKTVSESITGREIANDAYKFDFLQNARETRAFLRQADREGVFTKPFLCYQMQDGIFHNYNIESHANFSRFLAEMRETMTQEDYALILAQNNPDWNRYVGLLKNGEGAFFYFHHFKRCVKRLLHIQ